ncbi:MAG: hypothetical protein RSB38_06180, partial [Oscillospiraceae bacterium]
MKTKQLNQWIKQMLSLLKTKSVLVKMMSGYICIFLIVVMFNSCIYFYLKPIFIQKEVTNATNYLSYISERVDMNLLKVKDSMHKFLDNSEIIKGKRGKGIDDINSQLLMTSDLIYFMDSNPIVKYAAVYNPKNNIAIASDGTLSTATLIDKIAHESGLSQQDVLSGIENGKNFGTFPAAEMNSNDEKTTGYFTFYTGVSYSNNDYKMISFVSKEEIEKLLKKDNISEYSKTYILNRNYDTWLSTDGDVIDKDLIENDSKYDGNTAVTTKSAFQDWVYVSILNDKMIVKNLGFIKNTFLILILAMMGICIFISIKFVKSYYNPIANIIDRYLLTINGGTNEFDAISNTLENLKSENENSAEKEVLTGILKSGFYSDELEKMFEYNFFRIIVMRAISDESINFEIINQVGLGNDFVFKVIQETHNGCSIILNGDELSYNKTMALILGLQQEYFKETSVFAAFGISNICDELMDIHEAYKEAIMAIDHGDSSCESCIYMYRDINNINQNMYLPIDFERRMTEAVYT